MSDGPDKKTDVNQQRGPILGTSLGGPVRFGSLAQLQSLDSMEGLVRAETVPAPPLFSRLPQGALVHAVYPGVLVALTIGLASSWLSLRYGAPVMLFALLFGMAFHFLHEEGGRCVTGIEFSSRALLRLGVALLGMRITIDQMMSLGAAPVLMVISGVVLTIGVGLAAARLMGLKVTLGALSGGAVAICGASAALAIASVLPKRDGAERDTILTVVGVTTLSTIAMIFYPAIVTGLGLDDVTAGFFLGGTIHDVAQVVGAGYMISPDAGDVATYVKLLRVAMLLPVVVAIGIVVSGGIGRKRSDGAPLFPRFLLGFAALVVINSLGIVPAQVGALVRDLSSWCLVTAIAALGMKTSFRELLVVGWKPVALMVGETLFLAGFVLGLLMFVM